MHHLVHKFISELARKIAQNPSNISNMSAYFITLTPIPEDRAISFDSIRNRDSDLKKSTCNIDLDPITIMLIGLLVVSIIGVLAISTLIGWISLLVLACIIMHIQLLSFGKPTVIEVQHDSYAIIDIRESRTVHL